MDHFFNAENIQPNSFAKKHVSSNPVAAHSRGAGGSISSAEPAGIGEAMMQRLALKPDLSMCTLRWYVG